MANNYSKHITIFQNNPSIVKLLTTFFLIAKKLKAYILSPVPASTQRTSAYYLSKSYIIALLLLVMGVGSVRGATTYYSKSSNDPTILANWYTGTNGTGTHPANFTNAGDIFTVQNGDNMSPSVDWTVAGTIIINTGGTLTRGTNNITCGGLVINGTSVNSNGGSFTINGNVSGTTGTITAGTTQRIFNVTGNWTFSGSITNGDDISLNMNGTGTQLLSGIISNGTNPAILIINNASGIVTLGSAITTGGGAFTLTAGTFDPATYLLTSTNWTFTAGTLRVGATTWAGNYSGAITEPAGGTIEYNAGGAQTVNDVAYPGNLTVSGTGTKTWTEGGSRTITGNLIVADGSTLNVAGAYAFTVTGTTTIGNVTSGVLSLANATGTKTFTGAVAINSGANFTENAAATLSFGSDVTITGTLTENGAATVGFAGSLTNNGTYTASSGTHTFSGTGKTIGGTSTNIIPSLTISGTTTNNGTLTVSTTLAGVSTLTNAATGILNFGGSSITPTLIATASGNTVNYNGAGTQTVKAVNYSNLGISGGGSSIKTLGGGLTVSGTLTIAASTTLAFGTTAQTLTLSGIGSNTLSNSGTIDMSMNNAAHVLQIAASSIASFGTLTPGTGSTVEYTVLGGGQSINPVTYNNLKLDNTSGTNSAGGNLVINSTLTTTAGGTLDMTTAYSLSGTLSTITNNGAISTSVPTATSSTPIPSGKTWGGTIIYAASAAQTTMVGSYTNLISSGGGTKTLAGAIIVSGVLTLTNGIITTTSTNSLTITNTATTAITGGSTTSFINGPVIWNLPSLGSGFTYNFPVGSGVTYLPFALVNPTTSGTATAQVQATVGTSGTTTNVDGTLIAKANSEYWNLVTSANFTNSSVSITRQTPITPNDVAGGCTTTTGNYTSLGGTPGTNAVSNTNLIGLNRYFEYAQAVQTITTGTISGSPFCPGATVSVPYTISGTYTSGNVFTAQLSSSTGSFSSPVNIGTLTSTTAGTITATIPGGTASGNGYRIRVMSSNPVKTGTDNGINLTVNAILPVSVSIVASANPVCSGTSVTFTATPTNGGTTPSYQWQVNGTNAGTNSATYTYTPVNNDAVICVLTSNATPCVSGNPATSNTVTMTVYPLIANNTFNFTSGAYGTVCATAAENANAVLTAPTGYVFIYVGFASFGTPTGSCSSFVINPSCHATTSQSVSEGYLLGNNSATIPATNAVFGDPCVGTSKQLYEQAYYSTPTIAGNTPAAITGMVPTGGNGTYTYYWESSTTSSTSGFAAASGTNTAKDYTPGILTQTTWFRRTVYSGGCSNTSYVIEIKVVTPTITTSIASLTGFTYVSGSGPSTEQSFTVSGVNLNTNIIVTPPVDFEISTGTGASFVPTSQITLNVLNSTVTTTTIYVRMKAGLVTTPSPMPENIVVASIGATTQNVACTGAVIVQPLISPVPSSLSGFNYNFGSGPSVPQSFNVSGSNLTGNIVITPPTNYEISLASGSGYTSTITLTQSGGSVASTTIYVRLITGLVVNTYSGNIVLTSPYAVTQNVFCSGSVTAPIITVSTFNLAGFIYTSGSGPSASQFVSVSGTNLITNITVNAPDSFQISTDNTNWVLSIPLTQSGGSVTSTKIYVRLIAGLNPTLITPRNLTASSTGAITQNVICSGRVVNSSTLIGSVAELNGFMYLFGNGPSGYQTFTVSGASLTVDITLTPPSNYEISKDNGTTYTTGALTITKPVGNTLNPTLIYIRLVVGKSIATYSGNLVITSGTAPSVSIACSGQVLAEPTITAGATPGSSVCIGNTVTLNSTSTGGIANIIWAGPNGYYSQSASPPVPLQGGTVSATDAGTYTVYGSVLSGVNLLTNGGFESGNVGFGSSYGYVEPSTGALMLEGLYTIVGDAPYLTPNSVHDNDNGFDNCGYHTGTHEMVINGASTAGVIVWSESVSVQTGIDYQFSYYIQSINAAAPSQLQLYVNGMPAGPVYTAPTSTCSWTQFIYNTNSDINTVLQLTLINKNTAASGNDFALDDMMFQQIFQVSSNVNLVVNPVLAPALSVTASSNPVFSGTTVTFTASPTNGGTTPTYQWSVGGVPVSGATGSTYTFIPTNGQVVSCTMTSSLPCATPSTATSSVTMTVNSRTNYWLGSIGVNGTDWGTATNWTAGTIPAPGNDVEYASTGNAANTNAVNSLQLDQDRTIGNLINATTQSLIIPAGKGLIVNQQISIVNGTTSQVYIHSDPVNSNGSLIYHNPGTNPVNATVEMNSFGSYTSSGPVNGKYTWQYFGIPLSSVVANPTFYGSYVRSWDETGTSINNHWVSLNNSSTLQPFYGYEITQLNPTTIVFQGQLVNSDFNSGPVTVTSTALYPGQHIYANPYTAAINVSQINFGSDIEANVYLYKTGSYAVWHTDSLNNNSIGSSGGQYTAIPKYPAGNNGLQSQIPSMQGFLVKATKSSSTPNSTIGISYNSVITNNTSAQMAQGMYDVTSDTRVSTRIDLNGTNYGDRMWLFTQKGCTRNFDNGWDGAKMLGDALTPQIYAIEPDGNYQVDALDDINNTILGFLAGSDTEYTMTFTHTSNTTYSGIFLLDMVENKTVDITQSGSTYSFVSGPTPAPVNRFMIATRNIEKDAPDANTQLKVFSSGHVVFVQNLGNLNGEMVVYDMMGHLLKRATFGPSGVTAIQLAAIPGAYVVSAATSNERVSKRVILGE
jgi:hypothetical protein